jgi:hypothetical protein
MRGRLIVAAATLVTILAGLPATANELCASTATVAWEVDREATTVDAATVHTPGCADGETIGIQLLLDGGGELPEGGPLLRSVTAERAQFDLTGFAVRVEPVVGVRVFLPVPSDEQHTWQITVDRRFFNPAGSEQIGLRDLTILQVPHEGSYRVEGAPARYRETACADLGYDPEDRIAEGSGVFEGVTEGGRHIVCFQQVTPGRGQSNETEVLDGSFERDPDDRTEVLGTTRERPAPSNGTPLGRLAMTGHDLLLAVAIGFATVGAGLSLLQRRRA